MKHATDGMDDSMIPIARPQVGDPEIENVVHVLRSGMLAGGRFGRAALDYVTGAGGAVTDSQSGFRALNRKAVQLLAGTLKKDDFSIESEMVRRSHDPNLRMAEVRIRCRYGDFDTSAKNPVSQGVGVRGLGFKGEMNGHK